MLLVRTGTKHVLRANVRLYSTHTAAQPTVWSKIVEQKRLLKPAFLFILFGSAAVEYNKQRKKLDELKLKYEKKVSLLSSIQERISQGEDVNLDDELKLINKSFEYLGLGGTYFAGYVEKDNSHLADDMAGLLSLIDYEILDTKEEDQIIEQIHPKETELVLKTPDKTIHSQQTSQRLKEFF